MKKRIITTLIVVITTEALLPLSLRKRVIPALEPLMHWMAR